MEDTKVRNFCEKNNIELLVIFGSCASGKRSPESDIDIAVGLGEGAQALKLEWIYQLDDIFDGKDIDLVVLTADTEPLLLYEIFLRGRVLYERHPGIFDAGRLRAWKLYIDTDRLRVMQKNYLKEFAERVSCVA